MLLLNIFMHSFIVFLKKTNARQCHIEHIYDIMSSFFFKSDTYCDIHYTFYDKTYNTSYVA